MEEQFCLRWNDYHTNLSSVFGDLLLSQAFVDVTLACDGASLKAHKMILSACSPFFQDILMNNPCKHPVIILKDISFCELKTIVDFMYKGQVDVSQNDLTSLLRTAEMLKIKGLADMDQGDHTKSFINSEFQSNLGRITPDNFNYKKSTSHQNKRQKRQLNSQISRNEKHVVRKFCSTQEVVIRPIPPQEYIESFESVISHDVKTSVTTIKQQPSSPAELDNEEFGIDFTEQEINGENSNLQHESLQHSMDNQENDSFHKTESDILPGTSSHSPHNSHELPMLEINDTSYQSNGAARHSLQQPFLESLRHPDIEQNSNELPANKSQKKLPSQECPYCGKVVIKLKRHLLTHSDVRETFDCQYCFASYTLHYNLLAHIRNRHPEVAGATQAQGKRGRKSKLLQIESGA